MRDLRPLFDPTSVAVVGASEDPRKWGNWLARRALRGERRRQVMLVNRAGGTILSRPAFRSLGELPDGAELVVIAVPAPVLEQTVDEALEIGVRAIVAITAGTTGGALDAELARRVRDAGAVLLGPNCLGVYDAASGLELVSNDLPAGTIGLLSQSGNLALEVGLLAKESGLGFSRFVSLGNQADLETAELIEALAEHDQTEAIALYVEDFRDGRAFTRAAARATELGKPVILLTIERHAATERAVRSHTGALASDSVAIDAACRAAGIERVRTPGELVDLAQGLIRSTAPRGRRVAVLADGGGHGGIAASLASTAGLELPELGPETVAKLEAELPPTAACSNPVDLAGGGEQDIRTFERAAKVLLGSGEVDSILMTGYFGGYAEYGEVFGDSEVAVGEALALAARAAGRPLVTQTMHSNTSGADALRRSGTPVYRSIAPATEVLARLVQRAESEQQRGANRIEVAGLPEPAEPVSETEYGDVRALLTDGGIRFADQRTVTTLDEALRAGAQIGYPLVLKALGQLHKSDAGGVALGLQTEQQLAQAFEDIDARLHPSSFSVETMAPIDDGVELLIGARWDPRFGPIALAGLGGVFTEVMRDVTAALAPVTEAQAGVMLRRLRGWPLLDGARGRPQMDVEAAAAALAALTRVIAEHPELAELEVNPLLVLPRGAVALDARAVPAQSQPSATPPTTVPQP
jgi:acyl-CoA synthetase (NDP forming)